MTSEQIESYKQQLIELQAELQKEEQSGMQSSQPVELDQSKVGRLSRMDALQAQAMSVETQRRRSLKLQQIKSALQRIEDDDFGYCLDCGNALDHKRLAINPAALLCIVCAEKREN